MKKESMEKESIFSKKRLQQFNRPVWVLLFGTLFTRLSFFMAWPFFVVILTKDFNASTTTIGAILAISAFVGPLSGLYTGYLADVIGAKKILIAGCVFGFIAFTGIAVASSIWHFFVIAILMGLCRQCVGNTDKVVLSQNLTDPINRELAYNIRYFFINLGGAIGPLIGLYIGKDYPQSLFFVTGGTYIALLIAIVWGVHDKVQNSEQAETLTYSKIVAVLRNDTKFFVFLITSFIILFIYSQADSALQQIILQFNVERAVDVIVWLAVINTVTVMVFQFPLLSVLQRFSAQKRVQIGIIILLVSQIIFVCMDKTSALLWCVTFFVFSVGESIFFPSLNVQADMIAPEDMRGSYFGVFSLCGLGFGFGTFVSGWLIGFAHPNWYFALCIVLCVLTIMLYQLAIKDVKSTAV